MVINILDTFMPSRYFPKPQPQPQPLSPNTRTWVEEGVRYQKDKRIRDGKRRVKGTWTTDSIYYLWFEYLKRNKGYKDFCEGNKVRGMAKVYKDFGNVFEYEGVEGFWTWWKERGQLLFSVKPLSNIDAFFTIDDIEDYISNNNTTINTQINQIGGYALFPINFYWSLDARSYYSLSDKNIQDSAVGIKYNNCCWAIRLEYSYTLKNYNVLNEEKKFNKGINLMFELKGLGGLGSNYLNGSSSEIFNEGNPFNISKNR